MAAPQSRAAPPPPGARQPGRQGRILGLPPWAVVLGVVVVAGGIVFYWVRQRRASQQTTATGTAATPAGSAEPVDWSGEISTLQTEIADLQSSMAEQEADIGQESASQAEQEQDIRQDEQEDRRRPPCPEGFVRNRAGRCVKAPPVRKPPRQKNPLPVDRRVPNPPHHTRRAA